jgi:hypothetical protein
MSTSTETIRVALLALMAGVALPLAIQLYLAVRSIRRAVESLDQRLERTLADLTRVTAQLQQSTGAGATTSAVLSALAPALVAGVRAFRATAAPTVTVTADATAPRPQPTMENAQ